MKILGVVGWSGSGKTTLILELIVAFTRREFAVSTVKRAHHDFDIDTPGKDSYRHRHAGAAEVIVASDRRWALIHELRDEQPTAFEDLIGHLKPVDLLIVEGFKHHAHPKLEVFRPSVGKPKLWPTDPEIFAVASDAELADCPLPLLDLNDHLGVENFLVAKLDLEKKRQP